MIKKTNTKQVTLYLSEHEVARVFDTRAHYQLPYPIDDVLQAEQFIDAQKVIWDDLTQSWVK